MTRKAYETPVADLLIFDYKDNVTASAGGVDASHCFSGRNQGQCLGNNWQKCGGTAQPGNLQCQDN